MPRSYVSILNFSSGELSNKLRGRYDIEVYKKGAERLENYIADTQGQARFRNGTIYSHHTKNNNDPFLVTFNFNDIQSYILEFTDMNMRIFRDGSVVLHDPLNITNATQNNPVVITIEDHGLNNGDEFFIDETEGMTQLNGRSFIASDVTDDTISLTDVDGNTINGLSYGAYTGGGTLSQIVDIETPFSEEILTEIKYAENANEMYIVHPSLEPRKLVRNSNIDWDLDTFARIEDPFSEGENNYPGAVGFYEGRLAYGGTIARPETIWLSQSFDPDTALSRYDDFTTGADPDNALAFTLAPSHRGVDLVQWIAGTSEFLAAGTFGGTVKITGATQEEAITPESINAKTVDAFGVQDIMPISNGNFIIYMQRGSRIVRSFELEILSDNYESIDRNLAADHITQGGVRQIDFQNGRPDLLWAARNDGVLIGLTYKNKEDITGWHRHIIGGGGEVRSIAVLPRQNGYEQLWMGVKRTINGVTRHYIEYMADQVDFVNRDDFFTGGNNAAQDYETYSNAIYEQQKESIHLDSCLTFDGSVRGLVAEATLSPAASTGNSVTFTTDVSFFTESDVGKELWKKYINGVGGGRAIIEEFVNDQEVTCRIVVGFNNTDGIAPGNWYLTTNAVIGLDHLNGANVTVVTDGAVYRNPASEILLTVEDARVDLNYQSGVIHVGFSYNGLIKSMPVGLETRNGNTYSKLKNLDHASLRFLNTLGTSYGTSLYRMHDVIFNQFGDRMNRPNVPFSGVKKLYLEDIHSENKNIYIRQDLPLPSIIQNVELSGEYADE